jgi:hypothetical protein
MPQKISDSILEKKWPRNALDAKDNPYEAPTLAYNKEMGQLARRKNYQQGGGGLRSICKC